MAGNAPERTPPEVGLRVEFHCHTDFSADSLLSPRALLNACERKNLDRVVITDHNTIQGALIASRLDPARVIIGEEIMTANGELLAAYVQEEIPAGLSPFEAISRLRDQGAFISVSHPLDRLRGWKLEILDEIISLVDAIEIFNARCIFANDNHRASEYAARHGISGTVGSDAHTAREIGRAILILPEFHDASTLRQSLGQAQSITRLSDRSIHLASRWAYFVNGLRGASKDNPA